MNIRIRRIIKFLLTRKFVISLVARILYFFLVTWILTSLLMTSILPFFSWREFSYLFLVTRILQFFLWLASFCLFSWREFSYLFPVTRILQLFLWPASFRLFSWREFFLSVSRDENPSALLMASILPSFLVTRIFLIRFSWRESFSSSYGQHPSVFSRDENYLISFSWREFLHLFLWPAFLWLSRNEKLKPLIVLFGAYYYI